MSEYPKLATGAGDQYLAALAEVQDRFLKMVASVPAWTMAAAPDAHAIVRDGGANPA